MNPHIQNYYDQLAPAYDEDRFGNSYGQFIHQQELRVLQAFRAASPQGQVLDLACGTGRLLPWATHGVDISAAMLAQARSKYPDKDLRAGSALALSLDNVLCRAPWREYSYQSPPGNLPTGDTHPL
jgi:ubiquinone/menaquinone biosynthesis C-methylase UbiE